MPVGLLWINHGSSLFSIQNVLALQDVTISYRVQSTAWKYNGNRLPFDTYSIDSREKTEYQKGKEYSIKLEYQQDWVTYLFSWPDKELYLNANGRKVFELELGWNQ